MTGDRRAMLDGTLQDSIDITMWYRYRAIIESAQFKPRFGFEEQDQVWLDPPQFHLDAACRPEAAPEGVDWYAEDEAGRAAAIKICATCPVQTKCLESAKERREQFGVWGGVVATWHRRLGVSDEDDAA